jgi:hypothetical protein
VNPGTRPLTQGELQASLGDQLPAIVDPIRQIATDLGVRPYRVFLVKETWNGLRIGEGESSRVRTEILPNPIVDDLTMTKMRATTAGRMEDGDLRIRWISLTFSEHQLLGIDGHPDGLPDNMAFYWEVAEDGSDTPAAPRRRYTPVGVPYNDKDNAQWIVVLKRQQASMSSTGEPEIAF